MIWRRVTADEAADLVGPARDDLSGILEYVAADSRPAAVRLIQRIRRAAELCRAFPDSGRPGELPGTREIVVPGMPYILVYAQRHGTMEILRVRHGAQLWPPEH